jgi:PAS domain S-box-containing protein
MQDSPGDEPPRPGDGERQFTSSEELRREAADILGESRWWAAQLSRAGEEAADGGEEAGAAVIATDLDGAVTHWNAAAERLYGWSNAEAIGRPIAELTVRPEDTELHESIREFVQLNGSWEGELLTRRKDGSTIVVYVHDVLMKNREGRPTGIVGVSIGAGRRQPSRG